MAEQMDGARFWFPPKFSRDDDIVVVENKKLKSKNSGENDTELLVSSYGFPAEFPYEFDFSSALGSPVESLLGSTETESGDEDEFLAGLTRRLAFSTSQKLTVPSFDKNEKTGVLGSSPQSTLSGFGSWSGSSNGSPKGPSQVPSPSTTPLGAQNDTWDLIYAAAGQVARLKMSNEAPKFTNFNRGTVLHRTQNHSFMNTSSSGLYSSHSLSYNLSQTNQSHTRQMKASNWNEQFQQQQQVQQFQCRGRNIVRGRPLGLPQSSFVPLEFQSQQPQHNTSSSCMRPMFNGVSKFAKRGSAGTGVFIPRAYSNNPHVPHKKPGCSTVTVPTKAVQALNLNSDDSDCHVQPHFNASFAPNYYALVARRNALLRQTRVNYRAGGGLNLPQEWTY